jgi:hypothetical protein
MFPPTVEPTRKEKGSGLHCNFEKRREDGLAALDVLSLLEILLFVSHREINAAI